jgi:hypothetical protein
MRIMNNSISVAQAHKKLVMTSGGGALHYRGQRNQLRIISHTATSFDEE